MLQRQKMKQIENDRLRCKLASRIEQTLLVKETKLDDATSGPTAVRRQYRKTKFQ